MKEIDRLTNEKFKDSASGLFELMYKPALAEHKLRSKTINLITGELYNKAVNLVTKGRKAMFHKVIKIVAFNSKGTIVAQNELTDITFVKGDAMAVLPSRILKSMMKEVEKGGAIFIEKVWAK